MSWLIESVEIAASPNRRKPPPHPHFSECLFSDVLSAANSGCGIMRNLSFLCTAVGEIAKWLVP